MTDNNLMTIQQFIKDNCFGLTSVQVKRNPNMSPDGWSKKAFHYECTITHHPRGCGHGPSQGEMVCYYSKGSAHVYGPTEHFHRRGKPILPTMAEVLNCLALDALSVDNAEDFESWANDFGYDQDSRKVEATYDTCVRLAKELKDFLGPLYPKLLYETERL